MRMLKHRIEAINGKCIKHKYCHFKECNECDPYPLRGNKYLFCVHGSYDSPMQKKEVKDAN